MKRLVIIIAAATAACVSATPVTPSPIAPEEAPKLAAGLLGSCHVTAIEKADGSVKEAEGIHLTFRPDGKVHYRLVTNLGKADFDYGYKLDGRNVVSDGIYKTMRVEDYDDKKVKLFVYDTTQTFHCTRERAST